MGTALRALWRWTAGISSLLSLASAQACSRPTPITVTNVADLTSSVLSASETACSTYTGDIVIQSLSDANYATLSMPALDTVKGSLEFSYMYENSAGWGISAPGLVTVTDGLKFNDLDNLTLPSFPALEEVNTLSFSNVTFQADTQIGDEGLLSSLATVSSFNFVATNRLTSVEWGTPFNPRSSSNSTPLPYSSIVVTDNPDLSRFTLPGYGSDGNRPPRTDILIQGNGVNLSVYLPDINVGSLNISQVALFAAPNLNTLTTPSLPNTYGQAIFSNSMPNISLPGLGKVVDTPLLIYNNSNMTLVDLSDLNDVYAMEIYDNSALRSINLRVLDEVSRNVTIRGTINNMSAPYLHTVATKVNIVSNGKLSCASLNLTSPDCTFGTPSAPVGAPGASSTSGTRPAPNPGLGMKPGIARGRGLSTGAKAGIGVGVALGVLLLLALALFFIFRSRRRSRDNSRTSRSAVANGDKASHNGSSPRSPVRYSKVPDSSTTGTGAERIPPLQHERQNSDGRPVSSLLGGEEIFAPSAEKGVVGRHELEEQQGERFEMEEQQGVRHEMDARSLPDMDLEEEGREADVDRRSLEDIERAHSRGLSS